jgi:hypothetical protein
VFVHPPAWSDVPAVAVVTCGSVDDDTRRVRIEEASSTGSVYALLPPEIEKLMIHAIEDRLVHRRDESEPKQPDVGGHGT